jgi:uncharacterized protein (TIGR02453 family)
MDKKIKNDTLQFLKELKKNNDREWFNRNKDRFIAANENFTQFVQSLIGEVAGFDKSVAGLDAKNSIFRIYRDIRFSKDKSPYKTHFGATLMGKGGSCGVAGYYLHLEPGASLLGGGVHMTEPANLKAIREEISSSGKDFLKIINSREFRDNFTIEGEKLNKVPQGFDKEDPMAEYLKFKELMIHHKVSDKEILSDEFLAECARVCKAMVPFNKFVNAPLKSTH